ncbi:hypothetical protein H5410_041981 [Solanum commersonii]|uniref:Uncharacterized protein n=1 Tax=Solanum commersonii TaxID=4109 RepID=A0A9J5XT26_SOLCO|nr:hypothetical protein H5410_041981 [Solanum commersonii]
MNVIKGSFSVACFFESLLRRSPMVFHRIERGAVRGIWNYHWVVRRDLNVCRFEKKGIRRSKDMKSFIKYYYRLVPNRFTSPGVQYTWSRGEDNVKASQIDRFLISTKWIGSFKIIKQLAVSRVISNHKLLLLESDEWYTTLLVYKILELVAATRRVY